MNFSENDTAYYGKFKVTVEEVDEYNNRYLVSVNKSDVDWTGWVDKSQLSDEKTDHDNYPW